MCNYALYSEEKNSQGGSTTVYCSAKGLGVTARGGYIYYIPTYVCRWKNNIQTGLHIIIIHAMYYCIGIVSSCILNNDIVCYCDVAVFTQMNFFFLGHNVVFSYTHHYTDIIWGNPNFSLQKNLRESLWSLYKILRLYFIIYYIILYHHHKFCNIYFIGRLCNDNIVGVNGKKIRYIAQKN